MAGLFPLRSAVRASMRMACAKAITMHSAATSTVSAVSADGPVEYDDGCELTELCADLAALLREPTAKCKHRWVCLRGRVHNKGDGKGKYHAFVCTLCGKFQRRYLN